MFACTIKTLRRASPIPIRRRWLALAGLIGGAAYVYAEAVTPWLWEQRLFASDQTTHWRFGDSVALDGGTAVVGASRASVGGVTDRGAAYVFVREGDNWTEQAQLLASDGAAGDRFGWSVALDHDTAVVGARQADIDGAIAQGAVYVFQRFGSVWTQMAKLIASDGDELDTLGYSVAVDQETILAGARAANNRGAVYVFLRRGAAWVEVEKLFDPQGQQSDGFGHDVALDGDTALIGAEHASIDSVPGRGAAYVYTRGDDDWTLQEKLLARDGDIADFFGHAVALHRNLALIGAYQEDVDGNPRQGAAYIFRREGTTWTEVQRLTASDGHAEANFGIAAALRHGLALIGAEFDFPGDPERGVVYEFRDQAGTWVEIQKFAAPQGQAFDSFGRAIALTDDRLLVGNPDNIVVQPPGGTAWIFRRPTLFADGFESGDASAWSQVVP